MGRFWGIVLIFCSSAAGQVSFKTVALTGQTAHGTTGGLTYADFVSASIGDNGDVTYEGILAGSGVTL